MLSMSWLKRQFRTLGLKRRSKPPESVLKPLIQVVDQHALDLSINIVLFQADNTQFIRSAKRISSSMEDSSQSVQNSGKEVLLVWDLPPIINVAFSFTSVLLGPPDLQPPLYSV